MPPPPLADIDPTKLGLLYAAAVAAAVWLLVVLALRVLRAPDEPEEADATMELGQEPPAVANMLTNHWRPTPDAVPATLLDLAARGHVELQQVAPGQFECRIRGDAPSGLLPFEQRVLDHLRSKAELGVVPTSALTTGPAERARGWWRAFRGEVIAEAKARGLSEDLWNRGSKGVAVAAAIPGVVLFGVLQPLEGAFAFVAAVGVLLGWLWGSNRQRSTEAGLRAASNWLGVREHLRQDAIFDTLPPTAVVVWERYLAYGAALGQAAAALRPIAMGAESDYRAWSPVGGRWRQVRVGYPRALWAPFWGRPPWLVALLSALVVAIAAFLFSIADDVALTASAKHPDDWTHVARAWFVAVMVLAGVQLARAVIDLFAKRQVTGLVLRARRRGSDENPRFYLAIDDGSHDRIRAFRVRPSVYTQTYEDDHVAVSVTPNLRFVRSLTRVSRPSLVRGASP